MEVDRADSRDHVTIDVNALATELEKTMSSHSNLLTPLDCCIFRIPTKLSAHNEKAYMPDAFSIGPFHCKKPLLEATQKIKFRYLHDLISHSRDFSHFREPALSLRLLIEAIARVQLEAREHYAGSIDISTDEFVKVLVIDGCFIVELFRKKAYEGIIPDDDPIFTVSRMLQYLYHDLILLENQIPWMVLDILFRLSRSPIDLMPLAELAIEFFGSLFSTTPPRLSWSLFRSMDDNPKHILNLLRNYLISECSSLNTYSDGQGWEPIPSATSLDESGIKFQKSELSKSILDINFHQKEGVMEIPSLTIHENTDTLFRNLISLELYCPNYSCTITSYAMLFDNLIQTTADMKILCESGVITNRLHLDDATKIFNHPYEEYACVKENYFLLLIQNVLRYRRQRRDYYIRRWKVYRRELKRVYFNHPWAVISTVAASIMLILTFLQTLFTYIYR